jgi:tRNA(fMet)-specific endonuclease VapC
MSYLLDTDICIYILNQGDPKLRKKFQEKAAARLAVSALTEAELYYGALHSRKAKQNWERVGIFLEPLEIIPFTSREAMGFAEIKEILFRKGKPIGAIDMMIAATALAHDLTLISNNVKHFTNIPKLKFENWV